MIAAPGIISGEFKKLNLADRSAPTTSNCCLAKACHLLINHVYAHEFAFGKYLNKLAYLPYIIPILPGHDASLCGQLSQVAVCLAHSAGKWNPVRGFGLMIGS
jgi:hypothetical protein